MVTSFINAQIYTPDGFAEGELYVKNGKIVPPEPATKTYDCQGMFLCPGLIDLQVNGIGGVDFTTSLNQLADASTLLEKEGTTSFLAAVVTQPISRYRDIIKHFSAKTSGCLGLHLEGPHINPKRRGAHPLGAIKEECAVDLWRELADPEVVKMVTLAPECPHSTELIELLTSRAIVVSCGHTEATFEQIHAAKLHGLSMVTHLFNAMHPFHQRDPGVIGYVLGQKKLWYSLIVDGVHLHPDTVAMAYNAYPEGLVLVSDSSARTLAGYHLEQKSGKKVLPGTDTIAGSSCTLLDAVNRLHSQTSCSFHEAIKCATTKPAEILGFTTKGQLLVGYDADLIVLDEKGVCCRSFVSHNFL